MKFNNNDISLKNNLNLIFCYFFGDDFICSEDWCGYIKDFENYKLRNLLYSKYFIGDDILIDLKELFLLFLNNVEKLCFIGSI